MTEQTNAETFVSDAVHEAEIARLALLSELSYFRERKDVAKRLGISVADLNRLVKNKRPKKPPKKPTPVFDPDKLQHSAGDIIKCADILSLFAKELSKVIAGEAENGKLLYLVATSRLFDKTMNAAIKGTSAGGKSEIRKRVLEFFPPEDVISFTSLSEKSLIYYDGDFANKVLSMGEATAVDEQEFQDYLLRELMSEGCIRHSTVQKVGNDLVATTIEKQGPVAFLVTTTKSKLHPENETRMLSLEIDDSEDQTRKVLDKVAQVDGLHDVVPVDYKPWQDFQRWLVAGEHRVVVPFAAVMVELIPPVAVRLRRDVGQVIRAIKAHALLHRDQRKRDDSGQIVADIDLDYDAVRRLMNAIVAEGSGVAVNPAMVETVEAVTKATIGMADGEGASAKDIAKLLKLDKSAARRRLITACTEDLIVNLESRRGMPGKYRTTGQKIEPMAILPATADLEKRYSAKFADTSPESVPPCHREEIPQSVLTENGGKPGGKLVAGGDDRWHGWQPVANGFATDKSLEADANSPPVARWHGFSGKTEEKRYLTPANDASPQVGDACTDKPPPGEFRCDIVDVPDGDHLTTLPCAQCGAGRPGDLPTIAVTAENGTTVYVHEHGCLRFWKKEHGERGVAAPILDPCNEPPCDHCALPGGDEWDYDGNKVRLHLHCEDAWLDARRRLTAMPWTRDQMGDDELREWLASRKDAARKVDIATCEIGAWYHNMND